MSTCENCHHSREGWDKGPWDDEPDRLEFTSHGFPCILHRGFLGNWCGYVGLPPGHKLYGVGYDDVYDILPELSVHGGLTYSEHCQGPVCHVPKPGEPDEAWWLGFDCCHGGDYSPSHGRLRKDYLLRTPKNEQAPGLFEMQEWETYRDVYYAEQETISLAKQLSEMVS